uniref:Malate dehydrogenase 1B n=1 Tax=Coturnix japonica TaxID=93934 RepID=A0A8C2TXJ8_COTJA
MAKLVLAGRAGCPQYARAELLADYLQAKLPAFSVHKVVWHPNKWQQWLQDVCKMNGWEHKWSPIIWRELLDRGGKGLLLGGLNEFLEHAQRYYGITSTIPTEEILDIAKENLQTYVESEKEQEELRSLINPLQIWITSASAPICCQLIPLLASGDVFGMTTEISIHLLDTVQFKEAARAPRLCLLSCVLRDPPYSGGKVAPAFQRRGAWSWIWVWDPDCGLWPFCPAAWLPRVVPAAGGKTGLCGSRGVVHPPVIRLWVCER